MAKMTEKEIEKLAFLSRIKLDAKEKKKYVKDLSSILSYVDSLNEIDTSDVLPCVQVTNLENMTREDIAQKRDLQESQSLIAKSAYAYKQYIQVSAVFDKRNKKEESL